MKGQKKLHCRTEGQVTECAGARNRTGMDGCVAGEQASAADNLYVHSEKCLWLIVCTLFPLLSATILGFHIFTTGCSFVRGGEGGVLSYVALLLDPRVLS